MKTIEIPNKKFIVRVWPNNAADAMPVNIVATVDEYFFKIVSDHKNKTSSYLGCIKKIHHALAHIIMQIQQLNVLILEVNEQEQYLELGVKNKHLKLLRKILRPAYLKKKDERIPCAALLNIRNMVALECPCNISKLLGPVICNKTNQSHNSKSDLHIP